MNQGAGSPGVKRTVVMPAEDSISSGISRSDPNPSDGPHAQRRRATRWGAPMWAPAVRATVPWWAATWGSHLHLEFILSEGPHAQRRRGVLPQMNADGRRGRQAARFERSTPCPAEEERSTTEDTESTEEG